MVGADRKHRHFVQPPQFENIVRLMIQHDPSNARGRSRTRHLRKCGTAGRLEEHRIGLGHRRILNVVQQLLALRERVVVGMDDGDVDAQPAGGFLRRSGLLLLVIVIVVGE